MQRALRVSWWDILKNLMPIDYLILSNNKLSSGEMWYLMRSLHALSCWPPSSDLLQNDPSDIVSDIRSTIPLLSVSKSQSTSPLESTGSQSTLNEIVTFPNWFIERHNNTLIPCFPSWIVKTLEVVVSDVGDIPFRLKTQSQKQRASVALLTRVLETCDLKNYADAKGQPKWEHVMLT